MANSTTPEREGPYTHGFYEARRSGSRRSAEIVLPIVLKIISPRSVVDVGCATGGWLVVAKKCGVADVLGIDLERVPNDLLEIAPDEFLPEDVSQPLNLQRRFDLALALEVAEHLPATCVDTFLDSLVRLSPAILFSAAIPHQGGTGHLNEQWQDYWLERFDARGYDALDCVRSRLWGNRLVWAHYAQNTFLYVSREYLAAHSKVRDRSDHSAMPIRVVHPNVYLLALDTTRRLTTRP